MILTSKRCADKSPGLTFASKHNVTRLIANLKGRNDRWRGAETDDANGIAQMINDPNLVTAVESNGHRLKPYHH